MFAVPSRREQRLELREVGNCLEILRRLLRAKASIEIRADADVPLFPASWQIWSTCFTTSSSDTPLDFGVVFPRIQSGTSIHASNEAPKAAPREISSRICSSLNCRMCGTSVRQF